MQAALGHVFRRVELLQQALSHSSAGQASNERLEFLGDSLLGMVIASALYERFPEVDEGQLTRLRAQLVCKRGLAVVARNMGLDEHILLGANERRSGAAHSDKILGDALEALFAAVYLDAGFAACRNSILTLFQPPLHALTVPIPKDAKTRLQERQHAAGAEAPVYTPRQTAGPDHARLHEVACELANERFAAWGLSRRQAEQASAALALAHLQWPKQHPTARLREQLLAAGAEAPVYTLLQRQSGPGSAWLHEVACELANGRFVAWGLSRRQAEQASAALALAAG